MRILLNTRSDDAGARVCIHELGRRLADAGVEAHVNDWGAYDRCDVVVFMGYDHELEAARAQNPSVRVILADPKLSRPEWVAAARAADGLLVSSVEQRDVFLRLNRNVHIHLMFPDVPPSEREHANGERFVVGYHGNRVHLECLVAAVRPALEELGRRRPVTFRAIYNERELGRARLGLPDGRVVRVEHVQWTPDFHDQLRDVDAGIVPNELPVRDRLDVLERAAFPEVDFMYQPFDHLIRLKASTNPGRLFPFARLGIPVVTDFAPSAASLVRDGRSGFVVSSPHAWFEALEALAESPSLRAAMAAALRSELEDEYDAQVERFLDFCHRPPAGPPPALPEAGDVDDELRRLASYGAPRASPWRRVARRFRA